MLRLKVKCTLGKRFELRGHSKRALGTSPEIYETQPTVWVGCDRFGLVLTHHHGGVGELCATPLAR
jgi:hypothetical protein